MKKRFKLFRDKFVQARYSFSSKVEEAFGFEETKKAAFDYLHTTMATVKENGIIASVRNKAIMLPADALRMSGQKGAAVLANVLTKNSLRMTAVCAGAVLGLDAVALLAAMGPEQAFADELVDDMSLDVNDIPVEPEVIEQPEVVMEAQEVETSPETTKVDGVELEGAVEEMEDAEPVMTTASDDSNVEQKPEVTEEPTSNTEENIENGPFAADPNAVRDEDFVDYSNIDYHLDEEGNEVPHYGDAMEHFKEDFREPEPEPTPEPEPEPTPEPKPTPEPEVPAVEQEEYVSEITKTGDEMNMAVVAGIAGLSAAVAGASYVMKNRSYASDAATSSNYRMAIVDGQLAYLPMNNTKTR